MYDEPTRMEIYHPLIAHILHCPWLQFTNYPNIRTLSTPRPRVQPAPRHKDLSSYDCTLYSSKISRPGTTSYRSNTSLSPPLPRWPQDSIEMHLLISSLCFLTKLLCTYSLETLHSLSSNLYNICVFKSQ